MPATRSTALSPNAMIATPHHLASNAGLRILQDGGSAMDAVIAANAMLTVLYPDQTSLGGDCFFLTFDANSGTVQAFNGSGASPAAADAELLRQQGYSGMPRYGPLTVTVPGTVDAWVQGHEKLGQLEFADLFGPAIELARNGYPVSPRLADVFAQSAGDIHENSGLGSLFLIDGAVPGTRTRLRQPRAAATLQTIADEGRSAFYEGDIAKAIGTTVQEQGGWLTSDDLAAHRGEWVEPLEVDYRGTQVLGMPPNSQSLATLLALRVVERADLGDRWGSSEHLHPMIEAMKLGMSVRDAHLADPRFADIDTEMLLSEDMADALWSAYEPQQALAADATPAGDTVYLCAVDRDGNAVSMIQSIFQRFGSHIVAGDTGVILQNRGSYFSLEPDHINELAPEKRPLHTLMPCMLMQDGRLLGPLGSQGGDAQAHVVMQLISNVVDYGMAPQEAIDAPRWIIGREGNILLESGYEPGTYQGLGARGHAVTLVDPWNLDGGHAQMIQLDEPHGVLSGGADPRADGSADGY